MEQQITITHQPEKEIGYQWVLYARDALSHSRVCFATQQEAERYVILCRLYNQPI